MRREVVARILFAVAAVGALGSLTATVVGVGFLAELETTLDASLGVSADAVEALGATVELADDTLATVERSLGRTARTTRDVGDALQGAGEVLEGTAELTEEQLASSLQAVEDALPALIQVAAVIDRTLSALDALPVGPDYDPAEPFDDSLRAIEAEVDDLPDALRELAGLIRTSRRSLARVGTGTDEIANDLEGLERELEDARRLVADYAATAVEAGDLVSDSEARLGTRLDVAQGLVVVLGLAFTVGQAVPAGAAWFLRSPEQATRWLRDE